MSPDYIIRSFKTTIQNPIDRHTTFILKENYQEEIKDLNDERPPTFEEFCSSHSYSTDDNGAREAYEETPMKYE